MNTVKNVTAGLLLMGLAVGCQTAPKTQEGKQDLTDTADLAVKHMYVADPALKSFIETSAGYVVFPEVGKGGLIVGGSYGRGVVYSGGKAIGYADVTKASIGAMAGAQAFSEIIVFQTTLALQNFKDGKFAFAADATAVAIKEGKATAANYNDGVATFIDNKGGLMADASVGGQKFSFQPM